MPTLSLDVESTAILDEIINSACVSFMAAHGIEAERSPRGGGTELLSLAAVIGFAGSHIRGSLVLTFNHDLAMATCADCAGSVNILDWTGEVVNQLLGRIKNKLLTHDITIDLCTPVAISGKDLDSTVADSAAVRSLTFETIHGDCTLHFDYRVVEPFELRSVCQSDSEIRQEGELVLF